MGSVTLNNNKFVLKFLKKLFCNKVFKKVEMLSVEERIIYFHLVAMVVSINSNLICL